MPIATARSLRGSTAAILAVAVTGATLASVLTVRPLSLRQQPFPDAAEYADAARQLAAGNGYVTYVHRNEPHPPRYPPGFSLALAPFAALGGPYPSNVQLGPKVFAALYVLAVVGVTWSIGGPLAAALAAALVGASPFARQAASYVMSDGFAAALTVISVGLVHARAPASAPFSGALSGLLVVVRLSALLNLAALLIALAGRRRVLAAGCALPPLLALGLFQWQTFGSPFKTGYDYWLPGATTFDWSFAVNTAVRADGLSTLPDVFRGGLIQSLCGCRVGVPEAPLPNLLFYPAVLLGLFWAVTPPLATVPGLLYVWSHRRQAAPRFVLWLTILYLGFYAVYFYQAARFLVAPATVLGMYSAVAIAGRVEARLGKGLATRRTPSTAALGSQ